jgi:hypothetical protein
MREQWRWAGLGAGLAPILAKAKTGPQVAEECLERLRRYLKMLFNQPKPKV